MGSGSAVGAAVAWISPVLDFRLFLLPPRVRGFRNDPGSACVAQASKGADAFFHTAFPGAQARSDSAGVVQAFPRLPRAWASPARRGGHL